MSDITVKDHVREITFTKVEEQVKAQTAQNIIDNSIAYNLQWMDTALKYMEISKDNKNAVGEKVVSYLHILEAEMRRYYDL